MDFLFARCLVDRGILESGKDCHSDNSRLKRLILQTVAASSACVLNSSHKIKQASTHAHSRSLRRLRCLKSLVPLDMIIGCVSTPR